MVQPVISYPGAKNKFIKAGMMDHFPTDMKVFIEPFLGGASVSLNVAADNRFTKLERMIAGDLYTEMWAFWSGVKKDPAAVEEIATKWFKEKCPHQPEVHNSGFHGGTARDYLTGGTHADFLLFRDMDKYETVDAIPKHLLEHKDFGKFTSSDVKLIEEQLKLYHLACEEGQNFWKWAQTVNTENMTLEERAARMLLVNKISFSGMGDAGSLSKDQFCEFNLGKLEAIYEASRLLQRIEIYNVSFEETMKYGNMGNVNDNFIFLDPPYAQQESSGLYGKGGSTHKGFPHQHFADFTKTMQCKWFMTYDDSVIVRRLFQGTTADGKPIILTPFKVTYTMAGKTAEDALAGEELYISNYDINNPDDCDDGELDF